MKDFKAYFFDMDDTLINFGHVTKEAWRLTCQDFLNHYELNINLQDLLDAIIYRKNEIWDNEETSKEARKDFTKARHLIINRALTDIKLKYDKEMVNHLADNYDSYRQKAIYIYDGTIELLSKLKEKGKKLVMITNGTSESQRKKIDRFKLEDFFDLILIEGEFGIGKPNPSIYQYALDKLQLLPNEVCMIGDNLLWEVKVPQQLGIYSIWANYENHSIPDDLKVVPDLTISNIKELM